TPLTSSGASCVPRSDRQGNPASAAAWAITSDLPTPGGERIRKLCSCAAADTSALAWLRVTVSRRRSPSVVTRKILSRLWQGGSLRRAGNFPAIGAKQLANEGVGRTIGAGRIVLIAQHEEFCQPRAVHLQRDRPRLLPDLFTRRRDRPII